MPAFPHTPTGRCARKKLLMLLQERAHQRAAMTLYARSNAKSPMRQVVEYAEIITLVNLGRVHHQAGDYDAAVATLERAVEIGRSTAETEIA